METKIDARGERRRRIMSRESDRLALITGSLKNLPSSPPSSPSSLQTHQRDHSHTEISPSCFSKDHHDKDLDPFPIPFVDANSKSKEENAASFLKHEMANDEIQCQINHQLRKIDPNGEGNTIMPITSSASSMVQKASSSFDKEHGLKPRASRPKFFTSKRINSCILASQMTRVLCSLIVGLLVVLSYVDYPLFRRNIVRSESVVASKPIYILLLTDVAIVAARMVLERQQHPEETTEKGREAHKEDGGNWEAAVKVLERGLVVYQAFRAVFIDFSVYAVVVICGLSLV